MEQSCGTVIQLHPYSETSLIVTWCTMEHGLIRTLAKGAQQARSGFRGKLDLFFQGELTWVRSRRSELHTLCEVVVIDPRLGVRSSYVQTLAAAYFVHLIELVAEPETPIPELTQLLHRGLTYLAGERPTLRAILFFEKETTKQLGLGTRGIAGILDTYGRIPANRKELLRKLAD